MVGQGKMIAGQSAGDQVEADRKRTMYADAHQRRKGRAPAACAGTSAPHSSDFAAVVRCGECGRSAWMAGETKKSGPRTTPSPTVPTIVRMNVTWHMSQMSRLSILQEAGQQDRRGRHDEQQVQSDDAVDQHRGHGLGAMLRLFVAEHHGLDQIAADDAQRSQIEQISPRN